ncbi:hypothetical protein ACTHGP_06155 [[Pasteurella] aerogenes]
MMAITISPRTKVKLQAVVTLIVDIVRILVTELLPAIIAMIAAFILFLAKGNATETETEDEFDKVMKRNSSTSDSDIYNNPNNIYSDEYYSNIHNDD